MDSWDAGGAPRTSFLMPVRDGAATIDAAIGSVLAQTDRDLELVVVDDGSVDDTLARLRAWSGRDRRVRVIERGRQGHVAALVAGLAACSGTFIARFDADDLASEDRLASQIPRLLRATRPLVVDGQVEFFRDDGAIMEGMQVYADWVNGIVEPADFDRELLVESPVVNPAATCARSVITDAGGFLDGPFPEDYDLWLRAHARGVVFQKVPEILVRQRDHDRRLTRCDDRFSKAAFRTARLRWLEATVLRARPRIGLWGGGAEARAWLRVLATNHDVRVVFEINPRRIGTTRRNTIPVVSYEDLAHQDIDIDLCLVAVASRGARQEIRAEIARLRPKWREGKDWFALR